jgi:spermidine/putrescine transport system ATP-binding protein
LDNVPATLTDAQVTNVGVRPEMFTLLFEGDDHSERRTDAEVVSSSYYGDMTYYGVKLAGAETTVTISMRNTAGRQIAPAGSRMSVGWGADSIILFE